MRPEEVTPEWVEKAARAIHEVECCPVDQDSPCYGWPLSLETERARAALAAVLPLAQSEAWKQGALTADPNLDPSVADEYNPYREGSGGEG